MKKALLFWFRPKSGEHESVGTVLQGEKCTTGYQPLGYAGLVYVTFIS